MRQGNAGNAIRAFDVLSSEDAVSKMELSCGRITPVRSTVGKRDGHSFLMGTSYCKYALSSIVKGDHGTHEDSLYSPQLRPCPR